MVPVVSYLVHCETLLENATNIITKCERYFIIKCDKSLIQNVSVFLQNATVLFQNSTVITKWDDFIVELLRGPIVHFVNKV